MPYHLAILLSVLSLTITLTRTYLLSFTYFNQNKGNVSYLLSLITIVSIYLYGTTGTTRVVSPIYHVFYLIYLYV